MFKFVPKDQNILQIHFDIFKNIFLAEGHTIDGEWLLSQQLTHTHTVSHYGHSSLTMFTAEWPNILVIHVKQVLQKKTNSKSYVESLSIVSAKAGITKELAQWHDQRTRSHIPFSTLFLLRICLMTVYICAAGMTKKLGVWQYAAAHILSSKTNICSGIMSVQHL